MAKPKRTGGKSAPYDHISYTEEDLGLDERPGVPEIQRTDGRLTPETVEAMAAQVRLGVPVPVAGTAVGAGARPKHWAVQGRKHRELGMEAGWNDDQSRELFWLEAMETAKAQFESSTLMAIATAGLHGGRGDWKALAWVLERRASKRWHLQAKLQLALKDGAKVEVSTMSTEKLLQLARGLVPEEDIKVLHSLPADCVDAEIVED